jgi:hypothetical protein
MANGASILSSMIMIGHKPMQIFFGLAKKAAFGRGYGAAGSALFVS